MVRIMVGTLLKVEAGKILPCDISKIIFAKNRALAGSTAKAHGLYLKKVQYDS
jgi:tRNA pseudouridine38-40 synthase